MAIQCLNAACAQLSDDGARFCARCGMALPLPPPPANDRLVGQTVDDGRYRIEALIADGGMGRVYLATQRLGATGRKVAFKTILPDLKSDPGLVERFHREVALAIQLNHPNIVRFHDSGTLPDGTLFAAMEFVEGESLASLMAAGRLPAARIEVIVRQIASGLAAAHRRGVVHRDLKPDNVLLTREDAVDIVKIVDFGIARQQGGGGASLTRAGLVLGTPTYMAPEQFSQSAVTASADLYALGVITYQMLTGALPFSATTPWDWLLAHGTAAPIPFEAYGFIAGLLPRHRDAVMRALAKSPADRFGSVLEFAQAFTGDPAAGSGWIEGFTTGHGPAAAAAPGQQPYAPTSSLQGSAPPSGPTPSDARGGTMAMPMPSPWPTVASTPPYNPHAPSMPPASMPARHPSSTPWIVGALLVLAAAVVGAAVVLQPRDAPTPAPVVTQLQPTTARDAGARPTVETTPPPRAPDPVPPADPAAEDRRQVLSLLQQLDVLLDDCEARGMHGLTSQARGIQDIAVQMFAPIARFPRATQAYRTLRDQAPRFDRANAINDHADMHEHHGNLRRATAAIRAAVQTVE